MFSLTFNLEELNIEGEDSVGGNDTSGPPATISTNKYVNEYDGGFKFLQNPNNIIKKNFYNGKNTSMSIKKTSIYVLLDF